MAALLLASGALAPGAYASVPEPPPGLLGSVAPGFLFRPHGGRAFSLESLRGRVVVVKFWATWCKDCIAEMPRNKALFERFAPRGVQFLGVSSDKKVGPERVLEVAAGYGQHYPQMLAHGVEPDLWKLYRLNWIPTVLVIDPAGVIRHVDLGGASGEGGEDPMARVLESLLEAGSGVAAPSTPGLGLPVLGGAPEGAPAGLPPGAPVPGLGSNPAGPAPR